MLRFYISPYIFIIPGYNETIFNGKRLTVMNLIHHALAQDLIDRNNICVQFLSPLNDENYERRMHYKPMIHDNYLHRPITNCTEIGPCGLSFKPG